MEWTSNCGTIRLINGDALDVLPIACADRAQRVVVTDPPYSSGGFQEAGKSAGSIGTRQNAEILNDTMSSEGYVHMMRRVLRSSGAQACYAFTDWRMWGFTREAVELAGFRVRGMIVWDKGSAGMGIRWRAQHELIAWGSRVTCKTEESSPNVLRATRSGNKNHPTEKPVDLMARIITGAEPGLIVDPFCGSGSTAVAAFRSGRPFIGVELDHVHFATACARMEAEQAQTRMVLSEVQESLI